MPQPEFPKSELAAESVADDPVLLQLREYAAKYGRTSELLRLRDRLEGPTVFNLWDPLGWDPSHLGWGIGFEAKFDCGR